MSTRLAVVLVVVAVLVAGALFVLRPPAGDRTSTGAGPAAGGPARPPAPAPAPAGPSTTSVEGLFEVGFTQPRYPDRPADHTGGLDEHLVGFIDTAQRSVDIAIYDFDLPNVAQALARANARGAKVRMVTDTDTLESNNAAVKSAFKTLTQAGIPIVDDKRRAIMHHKFVVVDGQVVLTGSWNFTTGDTYRLNNNAVIVHSPPVAQNYSAEFEKMFVDRKFGPSKPKGVPNPRVTVGTTTIETLFSPQDDPDELLLRYVRAAKSKIDFLAFSFTDDTLGQAVMERAKAGVKVRGVFETTGSETKYAEYGPMKAAGLEVYQDGNPYVLHHKVFVIDDRITVFGSYNFSDNAATSNDENMLIVDDPALAASFAGEVERMLTLAKNPVKDRK
ncbi:MAG TPA: phospholipase D-like domain-containing protein [Chloroflexota bacterium]|nr:phospholipase D-like domain-containing protein [Chloroflexota bacterium]